MSPCVILSALHQHQRKETSLDKLTITRECGRKLLRTHHNRKGMQSVNDHAFSGPAA